MPRNELKKMAHIVIGCFPSAVGRAAALASRQHISLAFVSLTLTLLNTP